MESDATALSRLRLYLREHLNRSRSIESLAERILEQLRADESTVSTKDPVQKVRLIAAQMLATDAEPMTNVVLSNDVTGTEQEYSLDESLHRHLMRALMELPPEHARLFLAHTQQRLSCEEISKRFAMSPPMATLYLSQARALLRMCGWTSDSHSQSHWGDEYQRTLLAAHQAADWLVRFSNGELADQLEFLRWLRQDASHVRELLIALAWEDALDMLPTLSSTR